ncbi:CGP-CTERM-anchored Cys-rich protein [Thermococcus barossii]|uniref:Eight-cysteine-cluster domain-containing protein n=1 Tax=Thermococcus barossii TaxID=54077 RepID=A0A2Z2MTZ7_9EURY|nr:CGP-CTERM-anchored Cys-rich protein [Thermococcus barossii]ASJ05468.1 hypothetical protein A3L01_08875 [Thermococcus barossii]
MKRVLGFVILLMLTVTPLVRACITPADSYAVEVVLNKPGISYDLSRFNAAHNVLSKNGAFIFRSHYDGRLYVIVWNESDGLHVRVGIPIEWRTYSISRAAFNASLLVTKDAIERLKADGWKTLDNATFARNGITIALVPVGGECTFDADCATGGCSGEVCAPKKEAMEIVTPCVYREWYDCLSLTNCGCVNGICTWKPNDAFESCLREHGVEPSRVIRAGTIRVEVVAVNKDREEVEGAVKDFLGAFGISCDTVLTFVEDTGREPVPRVDPGTVNASTAVRTELEWLKEGDIVRIDENDIARIAVLARWGFAGHNSKIGWYETKDGTQAWIPYHRSRNPELVRCFSRVSATYDIPNGTAYFGPTATAPPSASETARGESGGVCGPGAVVLLTLLVALTRRR